VLTLAILTTHTTCKKETVEPVLPAPELPLKQLDYITDNNDEVIFKFFYENDTIVEYKYFGNYYSHNSAVFKNGKLFRYYYPDGHYVQYSPSPYNSRSMRITSDQDSTKIYGVIYLDGQRVSSASINPNEPERTKYNYYYNANRNLTKIVVDPPDTDALYRYYITHDDAPNPWFGMGIVNDFMTFSKNNYTTINDYPLIAYKYDNEGYMIESNDMDQGIYKYYYREK